MLTISNLSYSYGDNKVLNYIDLEANDGDIICIKGQNGAGKTTLMNLMSGILELEDENLLVDIMNKKIFFHQLKDYIAFIPSNPTFYEYLTGRENAKMILNMWKSEEVKFNKNFENLVDLLNMGDYVDTQVNSYSLGMRYKMFFACMLSLERNILLLDEPLNSMDKEGQEMAIKQIEEHVVKENRCVIFSSHSETLVKKLANKIYILNKGKLYKES